MSCTKMIAVALLLIPAAFGQSKAAPAAGKAAPKTPTHDEPAAARTSDAGITAPTRITLQDVREAREKRDEAATAMRTGREGGAARSPTEGSKTEAKTARVSRREEGR